MGSILLSIFLFVAFFFAPVTASSTTKYEIGPGMKMRDYTYGGTGSGSQPALAGKPSSTVWRGIDLPLIAFATGTGGNVKTTGPTGANGAKYPALCIPNPYRKMGTGTGTTYFNTGSGVVTQWIWSVQKNPAAASFALGFVHSCLSGTGTDLSATTCTATGCVSKGNTLATLNGYDYIKAASLTNPTASLRASLYVKITAANAQ